MNSKTTHWGIGTYIVDSVQLVGHEQTKMKLPPHFRLKTSALLFSAVLSSLLMSPVRANPNISDATIVTGTVTFAQPDASTLNITNSNGAIVDWSAFSIGAGEKTNFTQPNINSTVLNRITGTTSSDIQGQLTSNGRVLLVNPNGIVFGKDAVVDTGGLVASTLSISNEDFLNEDGSFQFNGTTGKIDNQGTLIARGDGFIALLAPEIKNSGSVSTENGSLGVAAGQQVELFSPTNDNIRFQVQVPVQETGSVVENLGSLVTDNGVVGVFADQLTHAGSISAKQATIGADGDIVLVAKSNLDIQAGSTITAGVSNGQGGTVRLGGANVNVAGVVKATALSSTDQRGGAIGIVGQQVTISGTVDASGANQGGSVGIGTDASFFDSGSSLQPDMTNIAITENGKVVANALTNGTGGNIFVGGLSIQVQGRLSAKGGSSSGNGGRIDVVAAGDGPGNDIKSSIEIADQAVVTTRAGDSLSADNNTAIGNGGRVDVAADTVQVKGVLSALGSSSGTGGEVIVRGEDIKIAGTLNAKGGSSGNGGRVIVAAVDGSTTNLTSKAEIQEQAILTARAGGLLPIADVSVGNGGTVSVNAGTVEIRGMLNAKGNLVSGTGGAINLTGNESISVAGQMSSVAHTGGQINISGKQITVSGDVNASGVTQGGFVNIGNRNASTNTESLSPSTASTTVAGTATIKSNAEQGKGGGVKIQSNGITTMAGRVNATAQTGGEVRVTGKEITVSGTVDVSGNTKGGVIDIGDIKFDDRTSAENTNNTTVTSSAKLTSDGIGNGNAGEVFVSALNSVKIDGVLSAQGGALSGNGGFIGTAGLGTLNVTKAPNASAANGTAGVWVQVSDSVTIGTNEANVIASALNTGTNVGVIGLGKLTDVQLVAIIKARTGFDVDGDAQSAGAEGAAKTASSGGIEVDAAITKTSGGDASLSLDADDTIAVNAPISSTSGTLNVALNTTTGTSDTIAINTFINTNGGALAAPLGVMNPDPTPTEEVDGAVENATNTAVEGAETLGDRTNDKNSEDTESEEERKRREALEGKDGSKKNNDSTKKPSSAKQC